MALLEILVPRQDNWSGMEGLCFCESLILVTLFSWHPSSQLTIICTSAHLVHFGITFHLMAICWSFVIEKLPIRLSTCIQKGRTCFRLYRHHSWWSSLRIPSKMDVREMNGSKESIQSFGCLAFDMVLWFHPEKWSNVMSRYPDLLCSMLLLFF